MPSTEKQVRVFISSTFRDMHAERDHLVTVVFPELRERVEQLGLEFFDVDLRWGVPAKTLDGETANSWDYCRQWIDRVEPFFVCILGQRYGWVPEPHHFRDDADRQRQQREPRSITDLEVRHAVLDTRRKRRSYFYLRTTPVPKPNTEYVDPPEYQGRLEELKTAVRHCGRPVRDYSPEWTGHGFVGLKEFGLFVLDDLWSGVLRDERYVPKTVWRQVLNADPDTDPRYTDESQPVPRELWEKIVALAKPSPPDPLDAEREQMEAFAATRLRWFQGRTHELQQLTDFIQSTAADSQRLAVVAAVPGQGKSALLAKLSTIIPQPSTFLITHFVGATERSATAHALVERLLGELDHSGIAWPAEEQKEGEEPKRDFNSLCERLRKRLGDYAGERRVVILLDALNQLTDGQELVWLPHRLGPSVRVVASCVDDSAGGPRSVVVDSPTTMDATKRVPAEQQVLHALISRQPVPLRVPLGPLTEHDVRTIVIEYLKEYCKELDTPHVDAVCRMEQARNPLYLLVMLAELRTLGGNEMNEVVPKLIDSMTTDHPDTVSLFRWVLQRLEVFGTEAVRWWCLYLAHGRVGMASHELADLLARKLGADAAVTALLIERGMRRYLLRRCCQLDFFHGQLRQAVAERYLLQDSTGIHVGIASYFAEHWAHDRHALSELPYHQIQGQRWDNLEATLTELTFLEAKNATGMVFDLAEDFAQGITALPAERPRRRILNLLAEALRRDIYFIARRSLHYPEALFQCLWNTCWWFDCSEASRFFELTSDIRSEVDLPWTQRERISVLMESWRTERDMHRTNSFWVRSHFPRKLHIRSASVRIIPELTLSEGDAQASLRRIAFSPCGKWIAFAAADNSVYIWNLCGDQKRRLAHNTPVSGLVFSSDGLHLGCCSNDYTKITACSFHVWDVHAGNEVASYFQHTGGTALSMGFSASGRLVASSSNDGELHVWDALKGRRLTWRPKGEFPKSWIRCVTFSPNDAWLGCCDERATYVWSFRTGDIVLRVADEAYRIRFSADGVYCLIDGRYGSGTSVWNLRSDKCIRKGLRPLDDISALVDGSPSFCYWAIEGPLETKFVETATGAIRAYFPSLFSELVSHPSGKLWAGDVGKHLNLFSLECAEQDHGARQKVPKHNSAPLCSELNAIIELPARRSLEDEESHLKQLRKYCHGCGQLIVVVVLGAPCSRCGIVPVEEDFMVITTKSCLNCGMRIPVYWPFCGFCGSKCE